MILLPTWLNWLLLAQMFQRISCCANINDRNTNKYTYIWNVIEFRWKNSWKARISASKCDCIYIDRSIIKKNKMYLHYIRFNNEFQLEWILFFFPFTWSNIGIVVLKYINKILLLLLNQESANTWVYESVNVNYRTRATNIPLVFNYTNQTLNS